MENNANPIDDFIGNDIELIEIPEYADEDVENINIKLKRKYRTTQPGEMPTKQRILRSAAKLFAQKGHADTTIKEITESVGMSEGIVYSYFESKNAILEALLNEYAEHTKKNTLATADKLQTLNANPTTDGILASLWLSFPEDQLEYFLNLLYMILQEQHRNPSVREFVNTGMFQYGEEAIKAIINRLVEINVIRPDVDADFFAKIHSSLIYTFSSRMLLGIGDSQPGYSGNGMGDLLRGLYDWLFSAYGVKNTEDSGMDNEMLGLLKKLNRFMNIKLNTGDSGNAGQDTETKSFIQSLFNLTDSRYRIKDGREAPNDKDITGLVKGLFNLLDKRYDIGAKEDIRPDSDNRP